MASVIRGSNNFDSAWGNGQTWQDVKASRANATTYTNSTSAPIDVRISTIDASGGVTFYVNGTAVMAAGTGGSGGNVIVGCIIPAGATYKVQSNGTISLWFELR